LYELITQLFMDEWFGFLCNKGVPVFGAENEMYPIFAFTVGHDGIVLGKPLKRLRVKRL